MTGARPQPPAIRPDRLIARMGAFAAIGATPAGGVDRPALSVADRAARRLLADLARERGFELFQDEASNLFIRRPGRDDSLPPLLVGSHLDSQPTGGRFDGALGTLTAFEVLEALEDAGLVTDRPVEVVAFANEEGSRFAPGCMGSMAFAGVASPADWADIRGADGARLGDELAATLAALPDVEIRPPGHPVSAFVELHIEQGPILESLDVPVGIVTAIQGTRWLDITMTGAAAHAGTTPRDHRQDALAAAVEAIAALQAAVMPADPAARLTVGRIEADPGSINVVPARLRFTVDIRHPDAGALRAIETRVRDACEVAALRHGCGLSITGRLDMPPARFAGEIVTAIAAAVADRNIPAVELVSGAFHDALHVGKVAPAAMIFVPCRGGVSHNEAEFVSNDHMATGAEAMLGTVLRLATQLS